MAQMMGMPQPQQPKREKFTLHIGNLSDDIYDTELFQIFKTKGYQISSVKVVFNRETKQHCGFGYINFYQPEEQARCLKEMNNAKLGNKQIKLSYLMKNKETSFSPDANLIIRNLPKELQQSQLMDLFKSYGNILSCKLEVDNRGESKGYGYV
jgi:polyadenylate-binding protein